MLDIKYNFNWTPFCKKKKPSFFEYFLKIFCDIHFTKSWTGFYLINKVSLTLINNIRYTKVHCVPRAVKKQSISAEDYLERIHELITEKGYARAVDIANAVATRRRISALDVEPYARCKSAALHPSCGSTVVSAPQLPYVCARKFSDP